MTSTEERLRQLREEGAKLTPQEHVRCIVAAAEGTFAKAGTPFELVVAACLIMAARAAPHTSEPKREQFIDAAGLAFDVYAGGGHDVR